MAAAVKQLEEQIGDDACYVERDQCGKVVVLSKSYEQIIKKLGTNGGKFSSLEAQIVADALKHSFKVESENNRVRKQQKHE